MTDSTHASGRRQPTDDGERSVGFWGWPDPTPATVAGSTTARNALGVVLIVVGVALLTAAPLGVSAGTGGAAGTAGLDGVERSSATSNDTDSVAPGEQFAGAIEREGARIDTSVGERTLRWRIARTPGDRRAELVAQYHERQAALAAELELERQRLETERPNMTAGEYRARRSILGERNRGLGALSNRTREAALVVPDEELQEAGVSREALRDTERRLEEEFGTFDREPPEGWSDFEDFDSVNDTD